MLHWDSFICQWTIYFLCVIEGKIKVPSFTPGRFTMNTDAVFWASMSISIYSVISNGVKLLLTWVHRWRHGGSTNFFNTMLCYDWPYSLLLCFLNYFTLSTSHYPYYPLVKCERSANFSLLTVVFSHLLSSRGVNQVYKHVSAVYFSSTF